ncbi:hypothetical protein [Saliphagus infecundisoli]|uniref:hypothetical protein n=1 Tax=Saliphagus infecundisoli TaxID=1849069 RepID=UPI0036D344E8
MGDDRIGINKERHTSVDIALAPANTAWPSRSASQFSRRRSRTTPRIVSPPTAGSSSPEDEGEVLEIDDVDGTTAETENCACSTLPGDYPCAACYIDGDAEWPDEEDDTHRSH